MNQDIAHVPTPPLAGWAQAPSLGWALLALAPALAWPGGWLVLPACASAGAGWWMLQRRRSRAIGSGAVDGESPPPAPAAAATQGGRWGADIMVREVVPVWARQLESTRDVVGSGLQELLGSFSQMSDSLGTLSDTLGSLQLSAEPGAVDQAVRREAGALDALTAASARAFAERDAMVAELGRCADAMTQLQHLAKQAREIARHTRLLAFNASIEANRQRGGQADSGSQAVATELRSLAGRMAETGEQVDRVVAQLLGSIRKTQRQGEVSDTTPEELRLEIDLQARTALGALLGALGASLAGSESLRETSRALREQLDLAFVNFQFGDRVSQMLAIVGNDMDNFARWVAANPNATQTDAAEWLAALEASYTMDEQRATHHGNVHVDNSAGVEFF
jgi:methyl-accepting chemotaxis protein